MRILSFNSLVFLFILLAFARSQGPVVDDVQPREGPTSGVRITITGSNFGSISTTTVKIGSLACGLTSASSETLVCNVPHGIGSGYPVVVSVLGVSSNSDILFSYSAPQITAAVGLTSSKTLPNLSITGINFVPSGVSPTMAPSFITFNNVNCSSVSWVNANITRGGGAITLPANETLFNLTVTVGGQQSNVFTVYLPPPECFGCNANASCAATRPAGQTNNCTCNFGFTGDGKTCRQLAPKLNSPMITLVGGDKNTTKTTSGSDFYGTSRVVVTQDFPVVISSRILSSTSMTYTIPPGIGTINIKFYLDGLNDTIYPDGTLLLLQTNPTYPWPTVTSASPPGGSTAGGYNITITGTNFVPIGYNVSAHPSEENSIFFIGPPSRYSQVYWNSSEFAVFTAPPFPVPNSSGADSTDGYIEAFRTVVGGQHTPTDFVFFTDPPNITSVTPVSTSSSGVAMRINGTSLGTYIPRVLFGSLNCAGVTFITNHTVIGCTAPIGYNAILPINVSLTYGFLEGDVEIWAYASFNYIGP